MPPEVVPPSHPGRLWFHGVLLASVALAVVALMACGSPREGSSATRGGSGDAQEGERIFRRDCLSCHGEDGNRIPVSPLSAKDFLDSRGDATLLAVVSDGKGTMPGFAKARGGPLSENEVRSVVAYVNSKAGRSTTTLLAGQGALIYTKRCQSCHGEDGMRIPISPLGAKGYLDTRTDSQLEEVISQGRGNMPGLPDGSAAKGEATAVISFLRYRVQALAAKSVAAGRDLYVGNCLACHGSTGTRVDKVALGSADYLSSLGDGKIITAINEGTKSGPPFGASKGGAFQVTDSAALIAYLKSWAGLNATAALSTVGAGGQGEALFVRNCAPCHGISGDQVPGVQLRSKAFLDAKTKEMVERTIRTGNRKGMPAWSQDAGGPLNDGQIKGLVEFLFAAEATPAAAGSAPAGGAAAGGGTVDGKPVADFFQAKCSACHGADRKGGVGPALLPDRLTKEDAFYEDTIAKGRPGTPMPSWSAQGVKPDEIKTIVKFLKAAPGGAAAAPAAGGGSSVQIDGKSVADFFQAKCAACHGADRKGVIGPALLPERLTKDNAFYEDTIAKGRPGTPMPSWSAQGMTPEQIKAMVEFLKKPPAGAAAPAPSGGGSVPVSGGGTAGLFGEELFKNTCALCHGLDGLNVKPCPIGSREWLSNMSPEGLITRISRGKPASGMPTWSDALGGQLTAAQISSVAAYLGEMAR